MLVLCFAPLAVETRVLKYPALNFNFNCGIFCDSYLTTRLQVEMVPRQPDVEDEDSDTTEQRAALEKESDARQHYELRVDNFGEQSQQKGGKKLERYSW